MNNEMKFLVTGTADLFGMYTTKYLRTGIMLLADNLSDYYIALKLARLELLKTYDNFSFHKEDICDKEKLFEIFKEENARKSSRSSRRKIQS